MFLSFQLRHLQTARLLASCYYKTSRRHVTKDSKYYLDLAHERGITLPGGFKYGEKPLLPGERRVVDIETRIIFWGLIIAFALFCAGPFFRPDSLIEKRALEEAERRVKALIAEAGIEDDVQIE